MRNGHRCAVDCRSRAAHPVPGCVVEFISKLLTTRVPARATRKDEFEIKRLTVENTRSESPMRTTPRCSRFVRPVHESGVDGEEHTPLEYPQGVANSMDGCGRTHTHKNDNVDFIPNRDFCERFSKTHSNQGFSLSRETFLAKVIICTS